MQSTSISKLDEIFYGDSGIKLLKSKSASLIITFFYNTFYKDTISTLSFDEFSERLEAFLKEHQDEENLIEEEIDEDFTLFTEKTLADRVKTYISNWLSEEKHYIRRERNTDRIEIIKLDSDVSRLLIYISKILNSDSISTETSFNYVLFQLNNLSENLNENPEIRIKKLESKKKEIEDEIASIKESGKVRTYNSREAIEHLQDIETKGKELISDFSQVEDNFREIIRETVNKQNEINITQNKLLGYSLSLHSELTKSNQYQSFSSFWSYMNNHRDDEISRLVTSIISSIEDGKKNYDVSFLTSLRHLLFESGKKIIDKNTILTKRMSRVMAQSTRSDRAGLEKLINSIRNEVSTDGSRLNSIIMEIDGNAELSFPMARTLQSQKEESHIRRIEFDENKSTPLDKILALKNEFHIDEKLLENNIRCEFAKNGGVTFTLKELTQRIPIEKGLEEIIAYILIAEKKENAIDNSIKEDVSYDWNGKKYKVTLPRIIFRK